MRINRLKLTDYRNCNDLELLFGHSKALIIGKNAQGKTNILESIYFISSLKSPRTSNISELIKFDSDFLRIEADVYKSNTEINSKRF